MSDKPLDTSDLAPQFTRYCGTGTRIRVRTTYPSGATEERNGRVGWTTGWRPAYLLLTSKRAVSSSDLLRATDEIVAVRASDGRYYAPDGTRVHAPAGVTYTEGSES